MSLNTFDQRRWSLCGRPNAERIALQMCEETGKDYSVVRTGCSLQPYKVVESASHPDPCDTELEVVIL